MTLTAQEHRRIRNAVEKVANDKGVAQHWTKTEIGVAVEAIEDRWDAAGTQSAIAGDIEAAAPGVFSAAEKGYLAAFWLIVRGEREKGAI